VHFCWQWCHYGVEPARRRQGRQVPALKLLGFMRFGCLLFEDRQQTARRAQCAAQQADVVVVHIAHEVSMMAGG
jgi:hypothetical protein